MRGGADDDAGCRVCRRRVPASGVVCGPCRAHLHTQLGDLLRKMVALQEHLVPTPGPAVDRVTGSVVPGTPTRLDSLSLIGPGTAAVTVLLHPQVRRWSATRTVTVTTVVGGVPVSVDRDVVDWFQELAVDAQGQPILVGVDDQVGVLPPAEWLDGWVRAWRKHFGHTAGRGSRRGGPGVRAVDVVAAVRVPALTRFVAVWVTLGRVGRAAAVRTVLGLHHGHGGLLPPAARPDDPLLDEWEIRFGTPVRPVAAAADVTYLRTWLDAACDADVGIVEFAGELRALEGEQGRGLGG